MRIILFKTGEINGNRGIWQMGSLVGFQVGLQRSVGADSRLIYYTNGVLLQKLITAGHMRMFSHIVLDEVHERTSDMDTLLLLTRIYLLRNSPHVKVLRLS